MARPSGKVSIDDLVAGLCSSKKTDRKVAVETLEDFAQSGAIERLPLEAFPNVYRGILSCLSLDRTLCISKGLQKATATDLARWEKSADMLRRVVDKTVTLINNTVVKSLVKHLLESIRFGGKLVSAVSLNYCKVFCKLLEYPPHLDHLGSERWLELAKFAWAVVLGDTLTADSSWEENEEAGRGEAEEEEGGMALGDGKRGQPGMGRKTTYSSMSPDQIACCTLIKLLNSSCYAPLTRAINDLKNPPSHSKIGSNLLLKFIRYFDTYPNEATGHVDMLPALRHVLQRMELNATDSFVGFSRSVWASLVSLLGSRTKDMREELLVILRILLPLFAWDQGKGSSHPDSADGLRKFVNIFEREVLNRGLEPLSLDALRLDILAEDAHIAAFYARTYRYGSMFGFSQAMTWVALDLHSSSLVHMYNIAESFHRNVRMVAQPPQKRRKLQNPLEDLLSDLASSNAMPNQRVIRLQSLLFLIERHWMKLYKPQREQIGEVLLEVVSRVASGGEAWAFLCFAAIAASEPEVGSPSAAKMEWTALWMHALRKSTSLSLQIARAASHLVHCLLYWHRIDDQRVLGDVESFIKAFKSDPGDADKPGSYGIGAGSSPNHLSGTGITPPWPSESICAMLMSFIRIASSDVRLSRLRLEDSILLWLEGCLTRSLTTNGTPSTDLRGIFRGGIASRIASRPDVHTNPQDLLALLQAICCLQKRPHVHCSIPLPDHELVRTMVHYHEQDILRTFILAAKLPSIISDKTAANVTSPDAIQTEGDAPTLASSTGAIAGGFIPAVREGKVSRTLELVLGVLWNELKLGDHEGEVNSGDTSTVPKPPIDKVRAVLDIVVLAFSFEGSLEINGTRPDGSVIEAASRLLDSMIPWQQIGIDTTGWWWEDTQWAKVLGGLEPLVWSDFEEELFKSGPDTVILRPNSLSGIRRGIWKSLEHSQYVEQRRRRRQLSNMLLRSIWRQIHIREVGEHISGALRRILNNISARWSDDGAYDSTDTTFGSPRRGGIGGGDGGEFFKRLGPEIVPPMIHSMAKLSVAFIATTSMLEGQSALPIRDPGLDKLVSEAEGQSLLIVANAYTAAVRAGTLQCGREALQEILQAIGTTFKVYSTAKSENAFYLVLTLLEATIPTWSNKEYIKSELSDSVRYFLKQWFSGLLEQNQMHSWILRVRFGQVLNAYVAVDPVNEFWCAREALSMDMDSDSRASNPSEETAGPSPMQLVCTMLDDEDVRVRYHAASFASTMFHQLARTDFPALLLYKEISDAIPQDHDSVERMTTRFITLANLAIIHSECRRGAYWHLLSVSFYTPKYTSYLHAVLVSVASRLGMDSLGELFESHAAQIAVQVRRIDQDLLTLPASLLGFRDRKECVDKTFSKVLPCMLLARDPSTTRSPLKDQYFENYCRSVSLDLVDTLSKCFADLVGLRIVFTYDSFGTQDPALQGGQADAMMQWIKLCLRDCGVDESFFLLHGDRVAAAILKCLWDHDYSLGGRIEADLEEAKGADAVRTFRDLMRYRTREDFPMHQPSPPGIGTRQTLHSMFWLGTQNKAVYGKAEMTYHILHQLFATINATPMVNEQLRLLHGMAVWISITSDHFNDAVLRRSLLMNSIHLLAQIDLARVAQSILGWVFTKYRESSQIHSRADSENIDTALMRISTIASDYETSTDQYTSKVGTELLDWVESEIISLHSCPPLRSAVLTALTLWPRQLVGPIATLAANLSDARHLTRLLRQEDRLQGKFRLVRQFVVLPNYSKESFSRDHFWALKQCIPTGVHLREEDVDAFLELLYTSGGVLEGVRPRHLNDGDSFLARHRHTNSLELKARLPAIKALVIDIVQSRLSSSDPRSCQMAYSILRQLLHSKCLTAAEANAVKKGQELLFISNRALEPGIRPSRSLTEMKRGPFLDAAQAYDCWIKSTVLLLADVLAVTDLFWAQLADFIQADSSFARELFPILVHQILEIKPESRVPISSAFQTVLESEISSAACQKAIVDTVLHLRWFQSHGPLGHDKWLALDYTLLSRAAIRCGAYTTAVMFTELAHEHTRVMNDAWSQDVEGMLYEVYSHIDEPDGFYAIPSRDTKQYLVRKFHHERNWDNAFQFHGAAYEAASTDMTASRGILESLHALGFDRLAMSMGESSRRDSALDVDYALAWRTGTWDLPVRQSSNPPSATVYGVLRAVHRGRDPIIMDSALRMAIRLEMERLRAAGDENMAEIRRSTQSLLCLREVKYWRNDRIQSALRHRNLVSNDWETFRQLPAAFDFTAAEAVIATRVSLLRSKRNTEEREQIGTMTTKFTRSLKEIEKCCLVTLSTSARVACMPQIALNSVAAAQRLEDIASFDVSQEFASVLWHLKEQVTAVRYLRQLVDKELRNPNLFKEMPLDGRRIWVKLLGQLGEWMMEACLAKPTDIREAYLDKAANLLQDFDSNDLAEARVVYYQCAHFADKQYRQMVSSKELERLEGWVKRTQAEIQELSRGQTAQRKEDIDASRRRIIKAQKILNGDKHNLETYRQSLATFLQQAIKMYAGFLATASDEDPAATIRFCGLWFSNFSDDRVVGYVKEALEQVGSYRFLFLAHQLTARLGGESTLKSTAILLKLVLQMCTDHPYHCVYQVFATHSTVPRSDGADSLKRTRASIEPPQVNESQARRGDAARSIMAKLREGRRNKEQIAAMEEHFRISLEWAQHPIRDMVRGTTSKDKKDEYPIPKSVRLCDLVWAGQERGTQRPAPQPIPVSTALIPIDYSKRYDNSPRLHYYKAQFSVAGGVSSPKINVCVDDQGFTHKQLFKGEGDDDLRQDAVMEQVFQLVNVLLEKDDGSKRRNLSIRTYKVIPLASQAGVLQFVENTQPLSVWLIPAHQRYYPDDWSYNNCLAKIRQPKDRLPDPVVQLNAFRSVRQNFHPVLRHFFTEQNKHPLDWYAKRLSYTRSVAVGSIVGHILGLGDRHISNLLLDSKTGELVHIDLGIAFDQGKLLPVPELVPFRLTADIVDGMGIAGTEGVFRRCAEETLRVLRSSADVIKTVLEVFNHDPLHSWTATAGKLRRAQDLHGAEGPDDMFRGEESVVEGAERALTSVSRKLDASLSVEYTVNELINEGTDIANLSRIFSGWSPHC